MSNLEVNFNNSRFSLVLLRVQYSMLSTKFRMTFRKIFCKCILSEQDSKILSDRRSVSVYTNRSPYETTQTQTHCSSLATEKRNVLRPPSPFEQPNE